MMNAVGDKLNDMLTYWYDHDLPGDFLKSGEFPFALGLEDQVDRIYQSAEAILSNDNEREIHL